MLVANRLKSLGLSEEKAHEFLLQLTSIGGRLTGSPQAEEAVKRAVELMKELNFDRVWTEPVTVNRWVRGEKEIGLLKSRKFGQQKINVAALGNSLATTEEGLEAGLVEVHSFRELEKLGEKVIKGKIVFFNQPMDRTLINPFMAYGQAAQFRVKGASAAAKYGAVAVMVRSATFRIDEHPHTGLMTYESGLPKIPAVSVATADAEKISRWLKEDPEIRIFLKTSCQQLGPVVSHNVIGELTGTKSPKEIILVGGHLDSWDLSPGAHDDAAGCAVAVEALRLIKDCGLKPARTIRAVLFMDEEFGGTGGRAYATAPQRAGEKHLLAIEQDQGGGVPLGLAVGKTPELLNKISPLTRVLQKLGLHWVKNGGGGVDIAPLVEQGCLAGTIVPNTQRYFDFHHSALDVPEAVHPRELQLQALALALTLYYFSQEGI
ncbi:MAG: M20/M25/M40 family metallo-hydrolase [Candidatus Aminicenantes bacterium]|nr:M20/M25/M40 family metallo-hydrolase [Candidatus Aminicenantes bacterium]